MHSLDEILDNLEKATKLPKSEILLKINKKYEEFSGLITKEGAAHLIAKEFGINLPNENRKQLQIKNIVSGMKNVNVVGRVFKISPMNEFERQGKKGKVVNLFVADNSGYIRLPLWNDQTKLVEDETIKSGDVIQIAGGLAKENIFGDIEISLGRFGNIQQTEENFGIPDVEELSKRYFSNVPVRVSIKDVLPGNVETKVSIIHIFKGKFLFDSEGEQFLVISCLVDDGTGSIRAVFFREVAEKVSGLSTKDLIEMEPEKRFELISERLLGKELLISGRARKNKIFDRLEIIVDGVKDLNALEESKKLVEKLELKIGG